MRSSISQIRFLFPVFSILAIVSVSYISLVSGEKTSSEKGKKAFLGFKETPIGGNTTFDCSPSGPCVSCLYAEKSDEKYRCSETGYRIPLKCVEIEHGSKDGNGKKKLDRRSALETSSNSTELHEVLYDEDDFDNSLKSRSLLADSSTSEGGSQSYITYRSCIPAVNEERLSVIGFEGIVLCLCIISGSVVYFRRKRTLTVTRDGAVRIPTSSRF